MGVPDVAGVWCHEAGGTRMFVAASVRQRYPGHARQVGHAVAFTRSGHYANRYVVVVDDDVDVTDLDDVLWAMCMHADPAESVDLVRAAASGPLDPRVSPDKRARGDYTTGKLIIDATRPFEWRDQFPRPVGLAPEARRALEAQWLDFLLSPGSAAADTLLTRTTEGNPRPVPASPPARPARQGR
jgi:4-hydroxy-3-polyprenylbenzoate decarboxylase